VLRPWSAFVRRARHPGAVRPWRHDGPARRGQRSPGSLRRPVRYV